MTVRQENWVIAGLIAVILGISLFIVADTRRIEADTCRDWHTESDCAVGLE